MWLLSDRSSELAEVLEDYLEKEDHMNIARKNLESGNVPLSSVWTGLKDELGLAGLTIPEDFGGGDGTLVDGAVSQFILGKKSASTPFLSSLLSAQILNSVPESDEQVRLYENLVSGQVVTVSPGLLQDVEIANTAEATYILNGNLKAVLDANIADTLIMLVADKTCDEIAVAEVCPDQVGLTVSARESWTGTRGYGDIQLENVEARRIGFISQTSLEQFCLVARAFLAAERLGGAFATLDMSVEYAKTRTQFDRLIGSFQGVKHPLADLFVQLHMAQAQLQWALSELSQTQHSSKEAVLTATVLCDKAFKTAAALNIDVHGGMGYTWEHDAHIYFRRAHSDAELIGGTTADLQTLQELLIEVR